MPEATTRRDPAPVVEPSDPADSAIRRALWNRLVAPTRAGRTALASIAVLGVFFAHFRPWQKGLLEEWGFVLKWNAEGIGSLWARMHLFIGRPLTFVPYSIGLVLSGGGFWGIYLVLALVAVAQLLVAVWAVSPLTSSRLLRWTAGGAIALHPWWAAGGILRFLPAQVAVLGVVVWLGAAVRFLRTGQARWVWLLVLAPLVGLLTYQAPAASLVIGSGLIALTTTATWRRHATLIALTCATIGAVMVWTIVIAPRLSPAVYESRLRNSDIEVMPALRAILRTIALHAPMVAAVAVLLAFVFVSLGFSQRLTSTRAWALLLGVATAPLASLAYTWGRALHLNDPERVALPIGVLLWIALCCALPALSTARAIRWLTVTVVLAGSAAGAFVWYNTWTGYAVSQNALISAISSVRKEVPADSHMVLADRSGRFGDVYLLLPPHLNMALDVEYGPGADVSLCTPAEVIRIHPTAARFPISTTPDCSALIGDAAVESLGSVTTRDGTFDLYELALPD